MPFNCQEASINETIPNVGFDDDTVNFKNDRSNESNLLSEVMCMDIPENGEHAFVYTDTDEKPVNVMPLVERQETTKVKEYKCDVCDAVFCHSPSIKEHMLQHKRSRPLHCSRCDQYFVLGDSFRTHKQQHEFADAVQCPICSKIFKSVGGLTTHMKLHEKSESYECGICCKSFGNAFPLIKHMESHTAVPLYECDICHERVKTLNVLEHHKMKVHHIYDINIYPYKCTICDMRFKKRSALTDHDWKHHFSSGNLSNVRNNWRSVKYYPPTPTLNKNDFVASNTTSLTVSVTQERKKVSKDVIEPHPGNKSLKYVANDNPDFHNDKDIIRYKPRVNEPNQSNDKLSEHHMDSLRSSIHKPPEVFMDTADECADDEGDGFVPDITEENGDVNTDMVSNSEVDIYTTGPSRSETPNSIENSDLDREDRLRNFIDKFVADIMGYDDEAYKREDNEENKEFKSYTCDLCSHEFEGFKAIKEHMLQHNKLPPHYCIRCDLYFVLARHMKAHLSQHELEDPLVCQLCNEVFHTPEGLKSHSLTHVEYFPYKCDICQRGFQTQNTYDLHMRFHSNTVFECSICRKNFSLKRDLQMHHRKEHFIYEDKKYRFCCNICEMKFKGPTALKRHKRYSHDITWDELLNKKGLKYNYYWRNKKR